MPPSRKLKSIVKSSSASKRSRHEKTDFMLGSSKGDDEEIESDLEDIEPNDEEGADSSDESLDARETAEQKRRRLAKEYLASMGADGSDSDMDGDDDDAKSSDSDDARNDNISGRLRKERLDAKGHYFRDLSRVVRKNSGDVESSTRSVLGGYDLAVTSVALSTDESFVLSGSKDNSVVRWDVETEKKQVLKPKWRRDTHPDKQASEGEILAVATTSDGRYAVSGGRDMKIRVFDARTANAEVKVLTGHRGAVTSLSFRRESYSLFSGSLDRCVKHWDLSEMGYLETMFGHQDAVTAVDCWTKERPISSATDRSIRLWKVVEESHMVYRGHKASVDAVQLLTEDSFVSGGQEGALYLWKESQKKPIASVVAAHGYEVGGVNANWISGLGSVKMSDLFASGSCDGSVRLWNARAESRQLNQIAAINLDGFVNSIAMSPRLLVAGTGREHRWGRWWSIKGNKNKVVVFKLPDLDSLAADAPGDESSSSESESESESDSSSDSGSNTVDYSGEEESD